MSEIICKDDSIHKDGIYDTDNSCILSAGKYTCNDKMTALLIICLIIMK